MVLRFFINHPVIFYLASPLFPDDKLVAKVMVYAVLVLETAQTIITSIDLYNALALNFGLVTSINSMQQYWLTIPVFGALSKSSVIRVRRIESD